jgi:hypothetical protein
MVELKRINFESKEFVGASGMKYVIELESLSVGRYEIYERLSLALAFGTDFIKTVFQTFKKIYDLATTGDSTLGALHKITETCHGQMLKLKDVNDNGQKDEFLFCTLFIDAGDEDRSAWDPALAEAKIKDWREYDVRDFFLLYRLGIECYANALDHTNDLRELPKKIQKKKAQGSSK